MLIQNETEKICGSWQRVPRRYRRQLRQDELYAQLTNKQGEVISGKVSKHYGLSFELFSALIGNQQNPGTLFVKLLCILCLYYTFRHINMTIPYHFNLIQNILLLQRRLCQYKPLLGPSMQIF